MAVTHGYFVHYASYWKQLSFRSTSEQFLRSHQQTRNDSQSPLHQDLKNPKLVQWSADYQAQYFNRQCIKTVHQCHPQSSICAWSNKSINRKSRNLNVDWTKLGTWRTTQQLAKHQSWQRFLPAIKFKTLISRRVFFNVSAEESIA